MITANTENEDKLKAFESGCDDFISKPFDQYELVARVKSLLRIKFLNDKVDEALAFAESVINTVREPLISLDQDLRVVTANHSFYETFKVTPETTIGQFIYDLGDRQWDIPKLRVLFEDILPNDTVFNDYEVEHEFQGIGRKTILLNARQIFRENIGSHIILLAMEDITERKLAEKKLQDKNTELERFTYTVSHDLKSPLMTIQTYAGMITQNLETGKYGRAQDDLKRIENATAKMTLLINDLLKLSQIGIMMNDPTPVDMNLLVMDCLAQLAGPLKQKLVEVVLQPHLPTLLGDSQRLTAVLQNLIENSIKYMGDQAAPRIEVGTRQEGEEIVFFVSDNGAGIDPLHHETIFGLFNKLDTKSQGSGVGLALVKRIVEVHGGRVWVESEGVGKGSTFCFTLTKSFCRSES
ncbi:MAG: GHKL domain-containing protein [Chitinophagaceae bacterium]|nr:GHKL domain-containing protein [Chitinophagaceae bacterium]